MRAKHAMPAKKAASRRIRRSKGQIEATSRKAKKQMRRAGDELGHLVHDEALPALHAAAEHTKPALHAAAEHTKPALHAAADHTRSAAEAATRSRKRSAPLLAGICSLAAVVVMRKRMHRPA